MSAGTLRPTRRAVRIGAIALAALLLLGAAYLVVSRIGKTHLTAYFPSTTGLYAGDDIRVLGVTVGSIDDIEPGPDSTKVTMTVDRGIKIPAEARAVMMAPSLVSARLIQLAPVYDGGPTMANNAEIPMSRVAVPVEWDDIKTQLKKLADTLGPTAQDPEGSFGRFVNTAADNLDGNGEQLKETLQEISRTLEYLSDGRQDLFGTVRNLQSFVNALSNSNEQIVQFGGRLASVSSVLAASSDELGQALNDLDTALGDVQRFVADNRGTLNESVTRLADVTEVLARKRPELERILHIAPTALANFNQIYKPAQGTLTGAVNLGNLGNPVAFLCGSVGAIEYHDSDKSAALCAQYLAPVLSSIMMNYPPFLTNPVTGMHAFPDQLEFSPPELANDVPPDRSPASQPVAGPPPVVVPPDLAGLLGGGR